VLFLVSVFRTIKLVFDKIIVAHFHYQNFWEQVLASLQKERILKTLISPITFPKRYATGQLICEKITVKRDQPAGGLGLHQQLHRQADQKETTAAH
jgi:hypothetical protein